MTAPRLTLNIIREKIAEINSFDRKELRHQDFRRFEIYNGHLEPALRDAIKREFKKPETIEDLLYRLVPINIVRKIINKLAGLYIEAPARSPMDRNEQDQILIDSYDTVLRYNLKQKEANRYFKLFKRNLQEVFIDTNGYPMVRNLPRHEYEVFSHSSINPNVPDMVVKILSEDLDPNKSRYVFWTDTEHLVVDGSGRVDAVAMAELNNPEGINPFGKLPFVYINESSHYISPISNDDLLRMGILIPLLLTDLCIAIKWQTWSIIWVSGYDGEIPASPNSIISLPTGPDGTRPEIGTVKPEVSIDATLNFIHQLTLSLLSTNNLSSVGMPGTMDAQNVASGISKALDESQSTEDKRDQQEYFLKAEDEFWTLLSKFMIPYWRRTNQLATRINMEFSRDFVINVHLADPQPAVTEKDQIAIAKEKLKNDPVALSTHKIELSRLYPDKDSEQINQLQLEIFNEQSYIRELQISSMESIEDNNQETEELPVE